MKTILSLFDYSGNWTLPYKENNYNTIQIDLKYNQDILKWNYKNVNDVYGVLAAPPCTDFSSSGAQYFKQKDLDGRTDKSLELLDKTIEIIEYFKPTFWALENPVGRINRLRPQLKEFGPWYFQPFWYGDSYSKKTGLWGVFNKPEITNIVEPVIYTTKSGKSGSWYWYKLGGKSERTKELRSQTPLGFAYAFYEVNK